MNSTRDFKHMKAPRKRELQLVKDECDLLGAELKNAGQGEAANLEDSKILLAACRIVISGYRSEISREKGTSLFVRAAYELLHRFLEQQFESHSHAA